jgi:hypothetical protein
VLAERRPVVAPVARGRAGRERTAALHREAHRVAGASACASESEETAVACPVNALRAATRNVLR